MKISRNELRQMILESLILEVLSKEDLIQQLFRGDGALDINKFDKANPLIKNIIKKGIAGSSGTVRTGQEAVAYLVHEIFPQVFKAQGIKPGSAQSVKFTLQFLQEFGGQGLATELAKIRPHAGPSYFAKLFNKNPTPMAQKVVEKIGGIDDIMKVAQNAGVIKRGTNVATATNTMNTALTRARPLATTITRAELTAAFKAIGEPIETVGSQLVKSGQPLSSSSQKVIQVADKISKAASKVGALPGVRHLTKLLRLGGRATVILMVLDAFYAPYALTVNGEFMGYKIGLGIKDMETPWGQLTYRRKNLKRPPAKPSDFNDQYKNLIAGLIWNQNKDPQAKEFVMTAIREDLIDLPAWKEYLAPLREAERKMKEAEEELASEEELAREDGGDEAYFDFIDKSKIESLGTSEGGKTSPAASPTKQGSKSKEWENYIERTSDKASAKKIAEIWEEVAKKDSINASPDYAGFVNWYKKTKNDQKVMSELGKSAGDDFTPSEALKLIDAAASGQTVKEHYGKSHATLMRERYRRY